MQQVDQDDLRTACPTCGKIIGLQAGAEQLSITCPDCGTSFEVRIGPARDQPSAKAGTGFHCPRCGAPMPNRDHCPLCNWQHTGGGKPYPAAATGPAQRGVQVMTGMLFVILLGVVVPILVIAVFALAKEGWLIYRSYWSGAVLGFGITYAAGRYVLVRGGEGWWWTHFIVAGAAFVFVLAFSILLGGPGVFLRMALVWLAGMIVSRRG